MSSQFRGPGGVPQSPTTSFNNFSRRDFGPTSSGYSSPGAASYYSNYSYVFLKSSFTSMI